MLLVQDIHDPVTVFCKYLKKGGIFILGAYRRVGWLEATAVLGLILQEVSAKERLTKHWMR